MAVKHASISAASSGDNTLIAAKAGYAFKVLSYRIVAASAVTGQFKSASTALTGAMSLGAAGPGVGHDTCEHGCFKTEPGEALVLTLGGAVQVSGHLTYREMGTGA